MIDRALARKVLQTEAAAVLVLADRIDERFDRAVELLRDCRGRVILTGMGKSGIICQKIAATLSSVIQRDDVLIALSYSGETDEIVRLLEFIRRLGAKLIAITGSRRSTVGQAADVSLDCGVTEEACPMNLVPTASTTAALAIGDALAMTLLVEKGFQQEDFANLHPGGTLGKSLMRVEALMHTGKDCPSVQATTGMQEVLSEMSGKGLGMTCVVDDEGLLLGVITDGDLRRHIEKGSDLRRLRASDVMTRSAVSVLRSTLAAEALNIMETRHITSIVVVDDGKRRVAGVVHLHDLWRTEMF